MAFYSGILALENPRRKLLKGRLKRRHRKLIKKQLRRRKLLAAAAGLPPMHRPRHPGRPHHPRRRPLPQLPPRLRARPNGLSPDIGVDYYGCGMAKANAIMQEALLNPKALPPKLRRQRARDMKKHRREMEKRAKAAARYRRVHSL